MAAAETPNVIRAAGVVTVTQALAGLIFTLALLLRSESTPSGAPGSATPGALTRIETLGEAGYYGLFAAAVLLAGIALALGKHRAAAPVILIQILLLPAALWAFSAGSSIMGVALGLPALAVLILLFSGAGRAWLAQSKPAW